jgi:hypothetical protein
MSPIDGGNLRKVFLEVVDEYNKRGGGFFQSRPVLEEAARRLGISGNRAAEQALLTFFGDLFRQGVLAWGLDVANPDPPFLHLTERGRETLRQLSRDPANAPGYLADLTKRARVNDLAMSYLEEGLRTYNAVCWKATAVMVGAAAESLILELRDTLTAKLVKLKRTGSKDLQDWRIKRVLDGLQKELGAHKADMGDALGTASYSFWPAFTQVIRATRNEAGHPVSVAPVTAEAVHAALLIFPELAVLAERLRDWITAKLK